MLLYKRKKTVISQARISTIKWVKIIIFSSAYLQTTIKNLIQSVRSNENPSNISLQSAKKSF